MACEKCCSQYLIAHKQLSAAVGSLSVVFCLRLFSLYIFLCSLVVV